MDPQGDDEHEHSGIPIIISNGNEGTKDMWFDASFASREFYDIPGGRKEVIRIEHDEKATFYCRWALGCCLGTESLINQIHNQ